MLKRTILIILFYFASTLSQLIEVQNLNNNNGYLTIKLDEIKTIDKFTKVLHIINITEYEITRDSIRSNIVMIESKSHLVEQMFHTLNHNFKTLDNKINNLKPHVRLRR